MKKVLAKRLTILAVMIMILVCLPLCGLAAEYTYDQHTVAYNQNGEVMVTLLGDKPSDYTGMDEFKRDWNGDGALTAEDCNEYIEVEWSVPSGVTIASRNSFTDGVWPDGTVTVGNPVVWLSGLKPEDDGKTVTMKLINPNGDTFKGIFKLEYSGWIHRTPIVTTDNDDFTFTPVGQNHYELVVEDGTKVSIDFTDCIDTTSDRVRDLQRTTYELDPFTGAFTKLKPTEKFERDQYIDTNLASTDDDEISFTASAADPKSYRFHYRVFYGEGRMVANSNIIIDVQVKPGYTTANLTAMMGASETEKMLFIQTHDVLDDSSLTAVERNNWDYILGQRGVSYRWTSEDSYVQSLLNKQELLPNQTALMLVSDDGDLTRLFGKTIRCAVVVDEEEVACINFKVSDRTIEMPTWVDPSTTPAFTENEDGMAVITAVEGSTVTIKMNHKYSKPLIYRWFIDGEEIGYSKSSYSLNVTLADNNKSIRCISSSGLIEELEASYATSWPFIIKVTPRAEEEEYKLEYDEGITEVPAALETIPELNTPAKIESTMTIEVMAQASEAGLEISGDRTEVYDVKLMYSEDGGVTWIEATEENWPASGKITVTLPYPEGTGQFTHNFVVAHMFTTTTADHKAGDIEYPAVTNTAQGIQFQVSSLSPIAIAWDEKPEVVAPAVPATGDNATPALWLMGMVAACGCMMLLGKRRQHN